MHFERILISQVNHKLAEIIKCNGSIVDLINVMQLLLPFDAVFSCINHKQQAPTYIYDSYPDGKAKHAVQLYIESTYLLNPLYNAYLNGLGSGIHKMADLAPDHWLIEDEQSDIRKESNEEIGYRTLGWPTGLQELIMAFKLADGQLAEISFARADEKGGFNDQMIEQLKPFMPLFELAFHAIYQKDFAQDREEKADIKALQDFAMDVLTKREAEIVHLILKGHSSLSIGLNLNIALPTVKSHRKNAYAKMKISSQQELFNAFLDWKLGK